MQLSLAIAPMSWMFDEDKGLCLFPVCLLIDLLSSTWTLHLFMVAESGYDPLRTSFQRKEEVSTNRSSSEEIPVFVLESSRKW